MFVNPPKKENRSERYYSDDDDGDSEAEIVAEDIEAGYDVQSDAAVNSLVSDPASSSEDEFLP